MAKIKAESDHDNRQPDGYREQGPKHVFAYGLQAVVPERMPPSDFALARGWQQGSAARLWIVKIEPAVRACSPLKGDDEQ